jgi:hypothetical protein
MAEPLTYQNARRRFEMPPREPASAGAGLSVQDRLALAKEEGRTMDLLPDELAELAYGAMQREMTPQTAGLLPSRGPVDDPTRLAQEPAGPTYDPALDSPILELVRPQGPPDMAQPPTLHTREELDAAIGTPQGRESRFSPGEVTYEAPTLSRPMGDRGEAATPPPAGQEGISRWRKALGMGLSLFDAAARGAAAGEKSGSFLGGFGAASEAAERREVRQQAHQADQRASAVRSARIEQESALMPEELELQRQNQQILNFYRQKQAEYMETLKEKIAHERGTDPGKLRRDQLNIIWRMAQQHARGETEKEMMRMRLAQSPDEAELMLARIESEQELAKQRRASAAYSEARTGEVGKPEPEDTNARMRNAATLLNSITRIENDLIDRYKRLDMRPGSPTLNQEVIDTEAMQRDPQYPRLQKLQDYYDAVLGGMAEAPETVSGSRPQGSPSPLNFDPNRIRQGVLQRMGAGVR